MTTYRYKILIFLKVKNSGLFISTIASNAQLPLELSDRNCHRFLLSWIVVFFQANTTMSH